MSADSQFNTYWGKELIVIDIPLKLLDNCEENETCLADESNISKGSRLTEDALFCVKTDVYNGGFGLKPNDQKIKMSEIGGKTLFH